MALPWMDEPVTFHGHRNLKCTLKTAEDCAYQKNWWRNSALGDYAYALPTVYFFCAAIALGLAGYWAMRLSPASLRQKPWWRRAQSFARYVAYKTFRVAGRWETPPLGVSLLIAAGIVFFAGMTLGPRPFYWPNTPTVTYGNSPPVSIRTSYLLVGCLPFMIIIPMKSNLIAAVTGTSHEHLMIYHLWLGWIMFVLALIHMAPFIIYNIHMGRMEKKWKEDFAYWSGVAAIVPQAYLTLMSVPWIRHRYYEFFKVTHIAVFVVFVFFFFVHANHMLTIWDYFVAGWSLYLSQLIYGQVKTYFGLGIARARFAMVSETCMKITVPLHGRPRWQPGQHVFIRFYTLGLHALTAHPFTICSIPNEENDDGNNKEKNGKTVKPSEMVFYVQPRGGTTARLAARAASRADFSAAAHVDGPYGGVKHRPIDTYDRGVVIAAGAGAAVSLPFVMSWLLATRRREGGGGGEEARGESSSSSSTPKNTTTTSITASPNGKPRKVLRVLLCTRDHRIVEWYQDALTSFLDDNGLSRALLRDIEIELHLTGSGAEAAIPRSDLEGGMGVGGAALAAVQSSESGIESQITAADTSAGETTEEDEKKAGQRRAQAAGESSVSIARTRAATNASSSCGSSSSPSPLLFEVRTGRPDVAGFVRAATLEGEGTAEEKEKNAEGQGAESDVEGASVGIVVCGPEGIVKAVQDEAAAAQVRIMRGERGGAREVYLHAEIFSG